MTEIGEAVGLAFNKTHKNSSENCPFCPKEEPEPWTTHAGEANDSTVLRSLLAKPADLQQRQGGARPKNGETARQAERKGEKSPTPDHDVYSFEAHHLISGNQAMAKVPAIEGWIKRSTEGSRVDADSGYSVNNARNGVWLPSVPKSMQEGGWGDLKHKLKFELAVDAMTLEDQPNGQFHKGPHNVNVDKGLEEKHHDNYDEWLKKVLQEIANRISDWASHCPLCPKEKDAKLHPSVRVNEVLDRLSDIVRTKVTGPPRHWEIFVSKLAYWYHQEHHGRGRNEMFDQNDAYVPGSCKERCGIIL